MILIPTIELSSGAVVDPTSGEVLADDPVWVGRLMRDRGALLVHLRGATADVTEQGRRFADAGLPCVVEANDGSDWSPTDAEQLLAAGVDGLVVPQVVESVVGASRQVLRVTGEADIADGVGRVVRGCTIDEAEALVEGHDPDGPQLFLEVAIQSSEQLGFLSGLAERGLAGVLLPGAVRRALEAESAEQAAQPN